MSPYGVFNATGPFPDADQQFGALTASLSSMGLAYLHVLDHSSMGAPPVPSELKAAMRAAFKGPFILAGGFDRDSAERALVDGRADLIAFARSFLANPDLLTRMQTASTMSTPDDLTFYTPGPKGYTDYPMLAGT